MLVTVVSEKKTVSLHLPERISGKYWIVDEGAENINAVRIGIEADEEINRWIIASDRFLQLSDEAGNFVSRIVLEEGKLYPVLLGGVHGSRAFIFAEPFTDDRGIYTKYAINREVSLTIGRDSGNNIIYNNPFVSSSHAQLIYSGGHFVIQDNANSNGTYVNQNRINGQAELHPGDIVFILGFKFIIGNNFISMNNPDGKVRINTDALILFKQNDYVDDETIALDEQTFYYRSPRFVRDIPNLDIQVDSPTAQENIDETPIMLTLAPSMLMGVASFSVGIFAVVNAAESGGITKAIPSLMTSSAMLIGMVVFPFIMKNRDKKNKREKEQIRRDKYLKYLENVRSEISRNQTIQREILNERNPAILDIVSKRDFWSDRLWGKTAEQSDFLFLRVGLGNSRMLGEIKFPADRFSIDDDVMRESLLEFQREERLLINVPVGVSLIENRVVGIVGDMGGKLNILNNMLLQLFLLHSYDEVKVICIADEGMIKKLSFVRYAQHLWDNEKRQRFLAVSEDNLRELSIAVGRIINTRREAEKRDDSGILPKYVILCASKHLANKCAFLTEILEDESISGFSVICAYDKVNELPKECSAVVEVSGASGLLYEKKYSSEGKKGFTQDRTDKNSAEALIRHMAGIELDLNQGKYDLPEMLTFMDMFGVGKLEHLNIMQRWKDNNPVQTLRTPIGVDTNGDAFYLDLHEKFHGPHGLVAGMTGSGKSEFIITYILSMAVNYHPDEVAFVLIDYKGGGLTGAFENENYRLPHLAGTITNLDGAAIMRSILSIKSELRRRQAVFNKARIIANEGTMDIYKYQKMYRDGLVDEAMPHLFIISDEFAELKSQQPEFMDQLISTARIGRSLGVHLILATQKPAGVVNEQIWANSKFKICLKVQDRADSMDMLKRPDAAELVETGRFYLQVGYNELFELGQSAWAGAVYKDSDNADTELDGSIEVINELGNVTDRLKAKNAEHVSENGKQIVRIMEYLNRISEEENLGVRQLWMPEIPADIRIDEIASKYKYANTDNNILKGLIGELDDPYSQSQRPIELNFTEYGNALVYGATGSGKEMLIQALLYMMYKTYSADRLNTYILDFGAEVLRIFENAPQTGGVIIDGEDEKIKSFFGLIEKELKSRRKILSDFGGDFYRYNMSSSDKLPYVLIIINNYSNFYENYERYEDVVMAQTRECAKYGIFYLVTATSASAVRYRMTQNFSQSYALQLNDTGDYASIFGSVGGIYPPAIKGRGIIKTDEVYVFQIAHIVGDDEDINGYLKEFCNRLKREDSIHSAIPIPVVPEIITAEDITGMAIGADSIPVGMSFETLKFIDVNMNRDNVLYALSEEQITVENFIAGLVEVCAHTEAQITVFNSSKHMKEICSAEYTEINADIERRLAALFEIAVERNNDYKNNNGKSTVDMTPMYIFFNGYGEIRANLSADGQDKLITMIDKVEGFCNMYFIIADTYKASGRYSLDSWVSNRTRGGGIWVGNGLAEQSRFVISANKKEFEQEIDNSTGYYVEDGMVRKLRLISASGSRGEFEDEE